MKEQPNSMDQLTFPTIRSDDLLSEAIRRMDDVRSLMHAAYAGGMTLERAGHVATAYSLAMRIQDELKTATATSQRAAQAGMSAKGVAMVVVDEVKGE